MLKIDFNSKIKNILTKREDLCVNRTREHANNTEWCTTAMRGLLDRSHDKAVLSETSGETQNTSYCKEPRQQLTMDQQ